MTVNTAFSLATHLHPDGQTASSEIGRQQNHIVHSQ